MITSSDVQVHGTYAWDLGYARIKVIGTQEVAKILSIPEELRRHEYMWINKGWIIEGRAYRIIRRDNEPLIIGDPTTLPPETWDTGSLVKVGDRIIYLADGNYYRMQVVA